MKTDSESSAMLGARDNSLRLWTALVVLVIIGSYVLTVALGVLCLVVPLSLMLNGFSLFWGVLLLAFGIVFDVAIVQALFRRREHFHAPGVLLDAARQPRLFAEVESIAAALEQPMPREVYILGVSNAFAGERTDLPRRENRRTLGLGFPLMTTLTVSEFRAIVAHEFAHFYSGDTRLGPWVYSARATMGQVLVKLHSGSAGKLLRVLRRTAFGAVAHLIVIGGISQYWNLLLRVTFILSRRQEYRSDELACHIGGSAAFTAALQAVHTTGVTFPPFWNTAVGPVLNVGYRPPLADGFARFLSNPGVRESAAKSLDARLKDTRFNPLDTHPPLADRIRRVFRIQGAEDETNRALAITLLDDLASLEAELIAFLLPATRKIMLRDMQWDTASSAVFIPAWKTALIPYGVYIAGRSIGQLAEMVEEFKKKPLPIPDPPGMLLTRAQRDERTSSILWMAMSVSLVEAGWILHTQPGENWIGLGNERIEPRVMITGLRSGGTSREQWLRYCEKLGIADLRLSPAVRSS